jgi:hypothetical protein
MILYIATIISSIVTYDVAIYDIVTRNNGIGIALVIVLIRNASPSFFVDI